MNESGNPRESDPSDDPLSGLDLMPIARRHDRAGFDCGIDTLNDYLKKYANDHATRGISKTYVATYDGKTIVGYYTVVPNKTVEAEVGNIPNQIPSSPISVVLLGRLAVVPAYRGRGIGEYLLNNALYDSQVIAAVDNSKGVFLDALKETGSPSFYAKYGFQRFPKPETDRTIPMYLSMEYIRSLGLDFPKE